MYSRDVEALNTAVNLRCLLKYYHPKAKVTHGQYIIVFLISSLVQHLNLIKWTSKNFLWAFKCSIA